MRLKGDGGYLVSRADRYFNGRRLGCQRGRDTICQRLAVLLRELALAADCHSLISAAQGNKHGRHARVFGFQRELRMTCIVSADFVELSRKHGVVACIPEYYGQRLTVSGNYSEQGNRRI